MRVAVGIENHGAAFAQLRGDFIDLATACGMKIFFTTLANLITLYTCNHASILNVYALNVKTSAFSHSISS